MQHQKHKQLKKKTDGTTTKLEPLCFKGHTQEIQKLTHSMRIFENNLSDVELGPRIRTQKKKRTQSKNGKGFEQTESQP